MNMTSLRQNHLQCNLVKTEIYCSLLYLLILSLFTDLAHVGFKLFFPSKIIQLFNPDRLTSIYIRQIKLCSFWTPFTLLCLLCSPDLWRKNSWFRYRFRTKESVYFTCSRSPLSREPLASQTISKVDNDSTSMGMFLSGIVSREGERMNKLWKYQSQW